MNPEVPLECTQNGPQNKINEKIIEPVTRVEICRNPDDNKFLGCARCSRSMHIVSSDKTLLAIEKSENIQKGRNAVILSVSRRTDIPNYYSDWFFNRIKDGYVYVRNPMNVHQISKIDISPEVVDCIVFWTKNPEPMMKRLEELAAYDFYFQFTLTGYGKDMECHVPHKREKMIPIFQKLSNQTGQKKIVWRYDPIIFTKKYTPQYHLKAFEQIAASLRGYTEKCVISFVDIYTKNKKSMKLLDYYDIDKEQLLAFAKEISRIAKENGMTVGSCAEGIDLEGCGIEHNCCIDKTLIESIIGCRIKVEKDKNQRQACGCMESIEIGTYNTCKNGCRYCYANYSEESVARNCDKYNPEAPILCGILAENDKITSRKVKSLKEQQLSIFDIQGGKTMDNNKRS